jgi:hypothetical protein
VLCYSPSFWETYDEVYQPCLYYGSIYNDLIGRTIRGYVGQIERNFAYDLYVDCAACEPEEGWRGLTPQIHNFGRLRGVGYPKLKDQVKKYGAGTRLTTGIVLDTDATKKATYPELGQKTFYYQYIIGKVNQSDPPFAASGDSGSIVVNVNNYALGMIFAADENYAVLNPMNMVLSALDVSLIT